MNHLLEILVQFSVVLEELPHLGLQLVHVVLLVLIGAHDVQEVVVHLGWHLALKTGSAIQLKRQDLPSAWKETEASHCTLGYLTEGMVKMRDEYFEFEPVGEELVHFHDELGERLQLILDELQHPCQLVCAIKFEFSNLLKLNNLRKQ